MFLHTTSSEGINYDFENNPQYINVGEYETQGIRYNDVFSVPWGGFKVFVAYTNSDVIENTRIQN